MSEVESPEAAAVVVTFFPDEGVRARLERLKAEFTAVIVVDNGSDPDSRGRLDIAGVQLLPLERNLGLAAALNLGLAEAERQGFRWAVTFDQDSTPRPGLLRALWKSRQAHRSPERVAVVGPRLVEERVGGEACRWIVPHPRLRWWFSRVSCVDHDLPGVAFVITSGALTDLKIMREIGPMDEALFIDYIDHDYCLRARAAGYDVVVSAGAVLLHNLGAKRDIRVAGRTVRPTFHSARRHRYMARNRWTVWRRHARRFPHWAAFDAVHSGLNAVRVLVFEDGRMAKLAAMLRGSWDGWLGRRGEIR